MFSEQLQKVHASSDVYSIWQMFSRDMLDPPDLCDDHR